MLTFWLRNFSALCCNVPTCQNIHIVKISPRITENEQWNIPNKCLVLLVSVVCNVQQHNYLHASNILSLSISTLQPETVFVVLSAKGSCDTVPQGFMPLFDLSYGRLSYLWVINKHYLYLKKIKEGIQGSHIPDVVTVWISFELFGAHYMLYVKMFTMWLIHIHPVRKYKWKAENRASSNSTSQGF